MATLPFAFRRPWYLVRDLFADRNQPQLEKLRRTTSPESFLWAILPHAARTFSACIAMLPSRIARGAAVGYLYCRILDTYEDLAPTEAEGRRLLRSFARRFGRVPLPDSPARCEPLSPAPPLHGAAPIDARDQSHLLLVECCDRVDAIFLQLPAFIQRAIVQLVRDMAAGMIWARRVFEMQDGRIQSEAQLEQYCHAVLGNPVAFAQSLMIGRDLTSVERANAMQVGEFIQLANVTRDIEKDLLRGIAYSPTLRDDSGATEVLAARRKYLRMALQRASAYLRMLVQLDFRFWSLSRASAMLMLEFTDRFYRGTASRIGHEAWPGPESSTRLLFRVIPAFLSQNYSMRRARVIEANMARFAEIELGETS